MGLPILNTIDPKPSKTLIESFTLAYFVAGIGLDRMLRLDPFRWFRTARAVRHANVAAASSRQTSRGVSVGVVVCLLTR